jgi:hypothetical protein
MFKELAHTSNSHNLFASSAGSSTEVPICYRTNRLSDLAMLWLQILQPWYIQQDFLYLATQFDRDPKIMLFDAKGNLNLAAFSILAHNSIASLTIPKDFLVI